MAIDDIAEEYFTYENRLASFQVAHPMPKRRASNASSKSARSIKWPHKTLRPEMLAKAGFFYHPSPDKPDNTACFLCHRGLDGWDEDDDPLVEHLKHSPDCAWALVEAVEMQIEEVAQEYPASKRLLDARKATFGNQWPHETKKGWKCKTKQMADAGWRYTPTNESDDMATCNYCQLALDGWENCDKPLDEHYKRSTDCPFFILIDEHSKAPPPKKSKAKRGSKASRLSTQSQFTATSEAPSLLDLPAEEDDSILTTATNATSKRMAKSKRAPAKGRTTRAKKEEPVEVVVEVAVAPEPEDDDFSVKVPPKQTRGKKRKSQDVEPTPVDVAPPPAKRRTTRTRGSMAVENSGLMTDDEPSQIVSTTKGKKGRASARGKRNTSNVSAVQATAAVPNDEELDAALAADLERPLSDEEPEPVLSSKKPGLEESSRPDHHMFGVQPADVDEAAIEAELEAMEMESKPLPKARATKAKQPRKVSAKQQAAAKKAAEAQARAEAEAEALAEAEAEAQNTAVDEASLQVAAELEQSISLQHSSPVIQAKKQRSSSRQPAKKALGRATRGSTMLANETHVEVQSQEDEPLEESDESIASQSTVVRGGRNPKSSGAKTVKGSKKSAAHEPEVIVDEASPKAISVEPENSQNARSLAVEDRSITEDAFFTPAPDGFQDEFIESTPKVTAVQHEEGHTFEHMESPTIAEDIPAPVPAKNKGKGKAKAVVKSPRSATPPPPADSTPSQSPQSSDAENHPPSSKPSAAPRMVATPSTARRLPLGTMTPVMSPSKRNIIAGLQSSHPWTNVDLDSVFTQSPGGKNLMIDTEAIFGKTKGKNDGLTCPEKQMTVEEWIQHNAQTAEGRLKTECERMVSTFESQGTRAMMALEGLECSE